MSNLRTNRLNLNFMEELSEKEIIRQIKKGNINFFEVLVNKYSNIVYYYTLARLKNSSDSEDVVQNAFIKAYKGIDGFDLKHAFYPWFFTIVKNEIIEFVRRNKTHLELSEEIPAAEVQTDEFEYLVKGLKAEYKKVLELYFRDGYSYDEIAKKLDRNINTVKTLIRRAKEGVKKNYEKE